MVQIHGKESGNKNAKSFKETSIYNKAELTDPRCDACGENIHVNDNNEHSSCPYCGYKPDKHSNYKPYRYEHEIPTQGIWFSEYRIKGKRRRKSARENKELEDEADAFMEEFGDELLVEDN